MTYISRIVDHELVERLRSVGAVVIEGARAIGKTETGLRASASHSFLDTDLTARRLVELDPTLLLEGATPRLLDEWQLAPDLWDAVRRAVDERRHPGQFILTGSAMPIDDGMRHSGAGRFSRLRMRPLSMAETGLATPSFSLAALLDRQPQPGCNSPLGLADIAQRLVVGGWPALVGAPERPARRFALDYLDQVSRLDIRAGDSRTHDPVRVRALLRSLARNTATEAANTTLAADAGGSTGPLHRDTVARYLEALERIFVLERQPAWSAHVRSRARLRNAPKWHLVDSSLAAAALGISGSMLLRDPETFGLLFESFVHQQLLVYSQTSDATVSHYRDSAGVEVDAIVATPGESWAAFEVKLSARAVDGAAAALRRFAAGLDSGRTPQPSALAVITAIGYGYRREDGVYVIPIGSLGP